MRRVLGFICVALAWMAIPAGAQRRPVLPQIDEPHPYYYREMYLPQLTSGPSSLSWGPDSQELVYSMAGSLRRQKLESKEAVQLTDGPACGEWRTRDKIHEQFQDVSVHARRVKSMTAFFAPRGTIAPPSIPDEHVQ